jgi:hypothetical protein
VSALAARSLLRRDGQKLATFSVDFTGSAEAFTPDPLRPSHDEPFARAAADYIGSRHSTVLLTADDLVGIQWEPLAAHDLPTMGDMYASMYLLFRRIREQSAVALSGESATLDKLGLVHHRRGDPRGRRAHVPRRHEADRGRPRPGTRRPVAGTPMMRQADSTNSAAAFGLVSLTPFSFPVPAWPRRPAHISRAACSMKRTLAAGVSASPAIWSRTSR